MQKIPYKYLPPTGGTELDCEDTLADFLLELPHLFYMDYAPPLNIINLLLSQGIDDAGMSGGAKWQPFVVTETEYDDIIGYFKNTKLNHQKYQNLNLSLIDAKVNTMNEWFCRVMAHKFSIPYEKHLKLTEQEGSLKNKAEAAFKAGNEEEGMTFHLQWIKVSNELVEFLDPYLES